MTPGDAPASLQQELMLAAVAAAPRPQTYNVATRIGLTGRLDVAALDAALRALIDRHVALRIRFGGDRRQQPIDPPSSIMDVTDLRNLPAEPRERIAGDICRAMAEQPFDLGRSTVPVCRLLRLTDDRNVLMLVTHLITTDGWALALLLDELAALYNGTPLATPGAQSTDYARWQRSQPDRSAVRLEHWRRLLTGTNLDLSLPTDHPRPATPTGAGDTVRRGAVPGVRAAVERQARERGVTPFTVVAAGLADSLSRASGAEEILFCISYANREQRSFESMLTCTRLGIGLLVPVGGTFGELIDRTGEAFLDALDNMVPAARIVSELAPDARPVYLAFQNFPDRGLSLAGLTATVEDIAPAAARGDLAFGLVESGSEYQAWLEYSTDLWAPSSADALLTDFLTTLAPPTLAPPGSAAPGSAAR